MNDLVIQLICYFDNLFIIFNFQPDCTSIKNTLLQLKGLTNKSPFHQSLTQPKYSRNKKNAGEHFLPSNFKQSISTSTLLPSRACYHNWNPTLKRKDRRNSVLKIRHTEGTEGILAVKLFSIKDETWQPFPSCHSFSLNHIATLQISSFFVKSWERMFETRWKGNKNIFNSSICQLYLDLSRNT